MVPPERQEIVFAGAGILWGATTFIRGLNLWRTDPSAHHTRNKTAITISLIGGFALIIGCSAYLLWSVRDCLR